MSENTITSLFQLAGTCISACLGGLFSVLAAMTAPLIRNWLQRQERRAQREPHAGSSWLGCVLTIFIAGMSFLIVILSLLAGAIAGVMVVSFSLPGAAGDAGGATTVEVQRGIATVILWTFAGIFAFLLGRWLLAEDGGWNHWRRWLKLRNLATQDNPTALETLKEIRKPGKYGRTPLQGTNLSKAKLQGATLAIENLVGTDLSDTYLQRANLGGVDLHNANLNRANLQSANLSIANLSNANLVEAMLGEAKLFGAILTGANLQGANLTRADFREANLVSANLQRTDLRGADLEDADLSYANLFEAQLDPHQLEQVARLDGATLPDGSKYLVSGSSPGNEIA